MVVILAGDSPRGYYPGDECMGVGVRIWAGISPFSDSESFNLPLIWEEGLSGHKVTF